MLKFIKHHMETISGIEVYPVFSFIIFFLFFIACLLWVIKTDQKKLKEIAQLPLEKEEAS